MTGEPSLLTGATGYVGGRLLNTLEERVERIRCLARRPDVLAPRVRASTTVVGGDVSDPATLAMDRPDPDLAPVALGPAFRLPMVRVALTAMIAGQVVMVMIMTSTPLHIHHHG